jgi:hypothetical protein
VYNPRFMKEIESSFAIDEDEEGAIPTLRDLQSRVQDPMQLLTRRAEKAEERLQHIEVGLRGQCAPPACPPAAPLVSGSVRMRYCASSVATSNRCYHRLLLVFKRVPPTAATSCS